MPSEECKWRLLNPLSIRFSQPRINHHFRDGHLLNETADSVYEVRVADAEWAAQHAGVDPGASAAGLPPYDVVLVAPFPAIRVISWLPKIRNADGEAAKDERGEQILGKRAWFALDNRRLYSLQTAAARRFPKRCCVVVRCLEEVPATTVKELRKFRTTTEGRSIDIGVHVGDTTTWTWAHALPPYHLLGPAEAHVEAEGLFAEDLWDAAQWAPDAWTIAQRFPAEEDMPVAKPVNKLPRASNNNNVTNSHVDWYAGQNNNEQWSVEQTLIPCSMGNKSQPFRQGGVAQHAILDDIFAALAKGNQQSQIQSAPRRMGKSLEPCPMAGWQYIDPAGNVQGPFQLDKMRTWHALGFFYPDLMMRCSTQDAFLPFQDLWPPGSEPFDGHVVRQALRQ
mmetsp:Transcript_31993/g.74975  ORF Transcript_31993/g.74975 Transcript_31993/m.74975 type:complete len:394 (-) Transcript_31993:118-1299(-)|eukprot:CAMPEP_0178424164 /NCGR_PEP_ID=MMETSP0689_2-20121128/28068_1 /TAXON_ID=160604 /ORGANISM="Amphidinium massartii, Strain CS-259" /LENGTH=393 /DNA_ID=CAMNT_0020045791 /DNA_START=92 /DNA_END=1273 /DNA_ORIENTATION=-